MGSQYTTQDESLGSEGIISQDVASTDRTELRNNQGRHFLMNVGFSNITDAASRDILFIAPTAPAYIRGGIELTGTWEVQIFEGASASANGTTIPSFACNRVLATAPSSLVFHTPTLDTTGSQLGNTTRILGGTGKEKDLFPGSGARSIPLITASNTQYLLRLTNQSGATVAAMDVNLNWVE